jgi:hypothetical protein
MVAPLVVVTGISGEKSHEPIDHATAFINLFRRGPLRAPTEPSLRAFGYPVPAPLIKAVRGLQSVLSDR